jgi:hypothetical protein
MYAELLLTRGIYEESLYCGVDVGEESGRREAFNEDVVPTRDDGVANDIRVGFDEAVEAAVDRAEIDYVARAKVFKTLEDKLSW